MQYDAHVVSDYFVRRISVKFLTYIQVSMADKKGTEPPCSKSKWYVHQWIYQCRIHTCLPDVIRSTESTVGLLKQPVAHLKTDRAMFMVSVALCDDSTRK